jgi:hypothetical protein
MWGDTSIWNSIVRSVLQNKHLNRIQQDGYCFVRRALSPDECNAALRVHLEWRSLAPLVGKISQRGWFVQFERSELPQASETIASRLEEELHLLAGEPWLSSLSFNEITYQRYLPEEGHISLHRDQLRYSGIIAVFTLRGEARISVVPHHSSTEVDQVAAQGDLFLFGTKRNELDIRPRHFVHPPVNGERISLTLRFNSEGAGTKWARP